MVEDGMQVLIINYSNTAINMYTKITYALSILGHPAHRSCMRTVPTVKLEALELLGKLIIVYMQ